MTAELLYHLWHSTLLLSLALVGVLALRRLWLRCFGAANVMLLWLSVPATLLALFLPAPLHHVEGGASSTFVPETAMPLSAMPNALSEPAITTNSSEILLALWLIGAVLMTALLALRQWRYRWSLGRLIALPDGSFRSHCTDKGPALVGALRPRIVVPANFDQRYNARQQFLILAHERCHLRRGDAQLTLLACLIRCLFWFNPLVHLAWSRFRMDQELACDATVLRRHPDFRREYAEAMLSTQFADSQLPVGCTWLSGNPLKRRITMLYTHPPCKFQLLIGTILALTASTAAAIGAWSSQEPQVVYLPASTPQPEVVIAANFPTTSRPALPDRAAESPTPRPAPVTTEPTPDDHGKLAPPDPPMESAPSAPAPPAPPAAPAPVATPLPAEAGDAAPQPEPVQTPSADPESAPETAVTNDHQPARVVEAPRPSFPSTVWSPQLVSYPGMPAAERPKTDREPDGHIWQLVLQVSLDKNGQPTGLTVAESSLGQGGFIRRYERLAQRAVKNWRFEPARVDGEAVASELMLPFRFESTTPRLPVDDLNTGGPRALERKTVLRPRSW